MKERDLRIAVTTAAMALAVGHHLWPEIRVDSFTGILLVLAMLPWLSSIIKAIELPGGVKVELQELRAQASEAQGAAQSAALQAGAALATAASAVSAAAVDTAGQPHRSVAPSASFEQLATEYNHVRASMESSPARISAMNAVVGKMLALTTQADDFDVLAALTSEDRGMRLAAYIYLYAKPDLQHLNALAATLTGLEDKPFNEYWAIRAVGNVAALFPGGRLPSSVCRRLHTYYRSLSASTDRHFELGRVLTTACGKPRNDGDLE